jgi:hypothetical protein
VRALGEERELCRALGIESDIQTTALASHWLTVARNDTIRVPERLCRGCVPAVLYRRSGSLSGVRISTGIWRAVFF